MKPGLPAPATGPSAGPAPGDRRATPSLPTGARRLAIPLVAASALLVTLGLCLSFRRTFAEWGIDGDVADMTMLWQGWQQYGWSFLRSWYYTQDNWILSLMPLYFAAFSLGNTGPALVLAAGWLVFVGCAGLTTLLAWRTAGRTAALWLAPLLALSGQAVLGRIGFLSYPVTHNISLFWGLLSFYASLRWLSGANPAWLAAAAAALVVDVASDPWASAAFLLPALLASLLLLPLSSTHPERVRALGLSLALLLAALLLGTRLFGLLGSVRGTEFELNDWPGFNANLATLGQVLPLMFNTYPGLSTPWAVTSLASSILLAALAVGAARSLAPGFTRLGIETRFLLLAGLLSCAGVTAAFLLGRFSPGLYVGRLVINVYVLIPLLLACGLARAPAGHWGRRLGVVAALAMMAAGVGTDSAAWRRPLALNTLGTPELVQFLEGNGLRYGYGPYWATQANAVTWLSAGRVRIRAVAFDTQSGRIRPRRGQTSALWYTAADGPPAGTETFVVIRTDEENCAEPARCRAGLIGQFGPPSRELTFGDATVLTWPGPLLPRFDGL